MDPSLHDRFLVAQRLRPFVNRPEVSTLGDDGVSAGEPVCFVEQKRMKLKEDLRAFTDDSKSTSCSGSRRSRSGTRERVTTSRRRGGLGARAQSTVAPFRRFGDERIGGLDRILGVRDRYRLDVSGPYRRNRPG